MLHFVSNTVNTSLNVLSEIFKEVMGFNGTHTLDLFFTVFFPSNTIVNIGTVLISIGLIILYGILIFQVFKGFFGPLAKAENPLRIVAKSLLFAVLVVFSDKICNELFVIATVPYKVLNATLTASADAVSMGDAIGGATDSALANVSALGDSDSSLIVVFLEIVVLLSILIQYYKLLVEISERYVITGVLSIFSPLCIATGISESTDQIFKSWIRMMLSQCILMMMSTFFLSVFEMAIGHIDEANIFMEGEGFGTGGPFLVLLMLVAWLRTAQRVDQHMSSLGLSVAQAGGGMWGDMFAGASLARGAVGAVKNGIKSGARTIGTAGVAVKHGIGSEALSNRLARTGHTALAGINSMAGQSKKLNDKKKEKLGDDAVKTRGAPITGAYATNAAQAKYGNTTITDPSGKSGEQTTLNDMLENGAKISSATYGDGVAEIKGVTKDGHAFSVAYTSNAAGEKFASFQGSEAAFNNAVGIPTSGKSTASQTQSDANGMKMNNNVNTTATGADGQQHDISNLVEGGYVDASGNVTEMGAEALASGEAIEGVTDGQGNFVAADGTALTVDGEAGTVSGFETSAYAMDASGQLHEVSGMDANGQFSQEMIQTDAEGSFVTADDGARIAVDEGGMAVNGVTDATYDAVSGDAEGAMALSSSSQMVDASGYANADGTLTEGYAPVTTEGGQTVLGQVDAAGNVAPVTTSDGATIPLQQNGTIATYAKAHGTSGSMAVASATGGVSAGFTAATGGSAVMETSAIAAGGLAIASSGGIERQYGSAATAGANGSAVSPTHVETTSGISALSTYGGHTSVGSDGNVQRYEQCSPQDSGAFAMNGAHYRASDNGSYAIVSGSDGKAQMATLAGESARTGAGLVETGASLGGVALSKVSGSDGYQMQVPKGSIATSDGNGVINISSPNGESVQLAHAGKYEQPEGAVLTSYGGSNYWATSTTPITAGYSSMMQSGSNSKSKVDVQKQVMSDCQQSGVMRDMFSTDVRGDYVGVQSAQQMNTLIGQGCAVYKERRDSKGQVAGYDYVKANELKSITSSPTYAEDVAAGKYKVMQDTKGSTDYRKYDGQRPATRKSFSDSNLGGYYSISDGMFILEGKNGAQSYLFADASMYDCKDSTMQSVTIKGKQCYAVPMDRNPKTKEWRLPSSGTLTSKRKSGPKLLSNLHLRSNKQN